ncbi:hypothetical protein EV193_107279 [Herbihabitans rhizosphaerae]|uniref:Uncharacterized protein n=1 Tax=Herbihabitans rhizosphaerae TaxID=1872711 RepID=A0A4Q7KJ52_9PSEU|nr:hypothetical protein [Herbihabitans rhizosphaerae]RZS36598.1 hypothetical protein EV193_107279 [Herbihabitans rhizosphaerae]
MSGIHRRSLLVLATACGLAAAGCDSGSSGGAASSPAPPPSATSAPSVPPPTSAPVPSGETAVLWMDGFCGAVNTFVTDNNATAKGVASSVNGKQLADYTAILDKALTSLAALPPAPVPLAETAKKSFVDKYTAARDQLVGAKRQLDAAPKSTAAQGKALDAYVAAQNKSIEAVDPVSPILASPELMQAAGSAKHCRPGT